jgi:hypothetical protein
MRLAAQPLDEGLRERDLPMPASPDTSTIEALAALGELPAVLQQRQLLVAADERCAGRPRLNRCGTIWRWPVKVRRERPRPSRDDLMVRGRYHRRAELSLLDATAFS